MKLGANAMGMNGGYRVYMNVMDGCGWMGLCDMGGLLSLWWQFVMFSFFF